MRAKAHHSISEEYTRIGRMGRIDFWQYPPSATHTGGKVARSEINQDGAAVDDARRQHGREQHQRAAILEQLGVLQHVVLCVRARAECADAVDK
jgi:hypothetical protein